MYLLDRQISRRLQAEAELRQHEKLQGVMEMAGAVCHELNQPMQAVSGYAEIIMMEIKADDPLSGKLESIKQQINRMGTITRKLMSITRYETTEYKQGKIIDIDKAAR
jgi:C4-dicarboxylate-specific signal transduction histidine kinase